MLKSDPLTLGRNIRRHDLSDRFSSQLFLGEQKLSESDEGSHDLDVHVDRKLAICKLKHEVLREPFQVPFDALDQALRPSPYLL